MKRTTLFLDEAMEHELHAMARRKGVPAATLVRESLSRYLANEKAQQKFRLRFLGSGHSGQSDIAERHEDLLWRGFKPHDTMPATKDRRRKPS